MNKSLANLMGAVALLGWSTNVAVTRHIAEAHVFGMPGLSFLAAGIMLVAFDFLRGVKPPWRGDANPKFWRLGASAFVLYIVLYVGGLSWSDSRNVVLPLGLINYFWPALILLLMPLFFPCRIRPGILAAGLVLCVAGVGMALLWGMPLAEMAEGFVQNWPAFLMMAGAAFLWAFYTNATRKWGGTANATGWSMLGGGAILTALWAIEGGDLGFTRDMLSPFILHAAVVNALSYLLWDCGARWGDLRLLGSLANLLPVGSVLFGVWYLGGSATPGLWIGGLMVAAGAALCRQGFSESKPAPDEGA